MAATFRGFGGLSTLSSHRQSSLVVSGAQPLTLKGSLTPQLLPHRRHRGSVQAPSSRPPLFPQRCRLEVVARRSSNSGSNRGSNNSGGARRQQPASLDKLVRQYAAPAVGLVVVGSLVAPLLGGLIFAAAGLGITMAAGAAALSLSWVVVPLFMAMFGLPALMMGGMAAGLFAGALLIPLMLQLVLVGGGLWLGASLARKYFYPQDGTSDEPDGTIDVEARTVDEDWKEDFFKEKKERESELREFDELLRRRADFKSRGPGGYN